MKEGTRVKYKDNPRLKDQVFVVVRDHGKLVYIKNEQGGRERPAHTNELEKIE